MLSDMLDKHRITHGNIIKGRCWGTKLSLRAQLCSLTSRNGQKRGYTAITLPWDTDTPPVKCHSVQCPSADTVVQFLSLEKKNQDLNQTHSHTTKD